MVGMIIFLILAIILIASGIGMLTSRNAVHAAMFLVVNLVTVALFFLGLAAPFLAMVQVTVYAGAIMVLFLFVIMLLGAERVPLTSQLKGQVPIALILVASLIAVTALLLFNPQVSGDATSVANIPLVEESGAVVFGSPAAMGGELFSNYALPLQMVAILLLVAMIGAVVLAKDEKPKTRNRRGPGAVEYEGGGD